jgi:hypothetical protein
VSDMPFIFRCFKIGKWLFLQTNYHKKYTKLRVAFFFTYTNLFSNFPINMKVITSHFFSKKQNSHSLKFFCNKL